jgi:curli biogenesis system outer membrane secretion channel CsgG
MFATVFGRKHSLSFTASLLSLALITTASMAPSLQAQKRRIAVMNLDVSPDAKAKAAQQLGVQNDLGETFAGLLITQLSTDGKFVLFERSALDKIIKEQNLSNSDRADQNTAIKLGRIAGVDGIVIGTVTQYTGEVVTNTSKGFSLGRIPIPGSQSVTRTVSVGLTARLIDTSTGLILASAVGTGTAKQNQSNMAGTTTTGSAMFPAKLTNDATTQAITQVVQQIEAAPLPNIASATPPPPPPPPVSTAPHVSYKGTVADVTGTTLIINVGAKAGVHVGDTIEIVRLGAAIVDPDNGKVIGHKSEKLGQAKITDVDEGTSTAAYSGTAVVKVKDHITSEP